MNKNKTSVGKKCQRLKIVQTYIGQQVLDTRWMLSLHKPRDRLRYKLETEERDVR